MRIFVVWHVTFVGFLLLTWWSGAQIFSLPCPQQDTAGCLCFSLCLSHTNSSSAAHCSTQRWKCLAIKPEISSLHPLKAHTVTDIYTHKLYGWYHSIKHGSSFISHDESLQQGSRQHFVISTVVFQEILKIFLISYKMLLFGHISCTSPSRDEMCPYDNGLLSSMHWISIRLFLLISS